MSKDKNAAFDFCEAEYFLALEEVVGRAAIINTKANEKGQEGCSLRLIDFIDDIASKALLKAVEDYGREKGMTSVVGPLGFTDMDPEGMLTWALISSEQWQLSITTIIIQSTWRTWWLGEG